MEDISGFYESVKQSGPFWHETIMIDMNPWESPTNWLKSRWYHIFIQSGLLLYMWLFPPKRCILIGYYIEYIK